MIEAIRPWRRVRVKAYVTESARFSEQVEERVENGLALEVFVAPYPTKYDFASQSFEGR